MSLKGLIPDYGLTVFRDLESTGRTQADITLAFLVLFLNRELHRNLFGNYSDQHAYDLESRDQLCDNFMVLSERPGCVITLGDTRVLKAESHSGKCCLEWGFLTGVDEGLSKQQEPGSLPTPGLQKKGYIHVTTQGSKIFSFLLWKGKAPYPKELQISSEVPEQGLGEHTGNELPGHQTREITI
ncbi:hypothetical protein P7K49_004427 [Saguinus oedipus]|uniref:Uncharacterized protein n=1 Tax=Saguinus oedipus TaxID=9490 RepID=A0ABQ9W7D3_SAGOE|nr:hypothetical protein P7K49_004427 [Saguinus oedipus]